MLLFHYSANIQGDPNYTAPTSISEAEVIRMTSFSSLDVERERAEQCL